MRKLTLVVAIAIGGALPLSSSALAAAPTATTGSATEVTSTTATLNGDVSSGKEQTTYHFQYGTTTAPDRDSTAELSVGKGNKASRVSADLDTLAPSTTYRYRLIATNASGTSVSPGKTFTTLAEGQAPPGGNAITIDADPDRIVFNQGITLSGHLVGPHNAGVALTLQIRYLGSGASEFSDGGNLTTDAAGNYSVALGPLFGIEEFRVVANTQPVVTSPVQHVSVAWWLRLNVSDATPKRGQRVRFSGWVTPANDGARAQIQRRTKSGRFRTVTTALLKHVVNHNEEEFSMSTYSKRVRIKRSGVYRVRMPGSGGRSTATTQKEGIRVH